MILVLLPGSLEVGTYRLQNLESLEPFRRLLGRVIVQTAAISLTIDVLLAQSAQFVQQI